MARVCATRSSYNQGYTTLDLERGIWGPGYGEVVPVPILVVTVIRDGILVGAFDGGRMIGFVYSLAGIKHGKPTQWSHMAGVLDAFRSAGVGDQLKMRFTGMLTGAPELALSWRMAAREIFTTYFGRGYRAVEFFLDRPAGKGAYLLVKQP